MIIFRKALKTSEKQANIREGGPQGPQGAPTLSHVCLFFQGFWSFSEDYHGSFLGFLAQISLQSWFLTLCSLSLAKAAWFEGFRKSHDFSWFLSWSKLSQQSTLTVVGTGPADVDLNRNLNGKVDRNKNDGKLILEFLMSFWDFQKLSFVFASLGLTFCALSPGL